MAEKTVAQMTVHELVTFFGTSANARGVLAGFEASLAARDADIDRYLELYQSKMDAADAAQDGATADALRAEANAYHDMAMAAQEEYGSLSDTIENINGAIVVLVEMERERPAVTPPTPPPAEQAKNNTVLKAIGVGLLVWGISEALG
jgi:hypothetical protein